MKARWKLILSLVSLVLISMAVGAYIGSELTRKSMRRRGLAQNWNASAMRTLETRLKLNPQQIPKIQEVLDRRVLALQTIRDETVARTLAEVDQLFTEVSAELTSEQKVEFEKLKKSRNANILDVLNLTPTKKPQP